MLASEEAVAVAVVAKLTKVQTEELLVVEAVVVLDSLQEMEVNLVMVVRMEVLVQVVMKLLLEMVVAVVIMETKRTVLLVEKVDNLEKQQIVEVVLKQVVDLVEETEQRLDETLDLVLQLTIVEQFKEARVLLEYHKFTN